MKESIEKDNIQKSEIKQKKVSSKVIKIAIAVFAIFVVVCYVNSCMQDIQQKKINEAMYLEMYGRERAVESTMNKYNLEAYSMYGEPIVNTLEDYQRMVNSGHIDLYSFYRVLGEEECEKVVIALGYENWEDFFIKNNHYDENGKPSIETWIKYEKEITRKSAEDKVKGKSKSSNIKYYTRYVEE